MPSAAAASDKSDKNVTTSVNIVVSDTAAGVAASAPIRQAITVIDHKIRNLQKRKSKLISYREIKENGKELNSDQKTALAKLDEVVQTLDFALEIQKQFQSIVVACEKEAKKQAKREAAERTRSELARIREVLLVQDALNQMGLEEVRKDFLQGRKGAAQLTETELKLLDDVYPVVTPRRENDDPNVFNESVQVAAENLLSIIEAKPKQIFDGTYNQVKEILGKIYSSQYYQQKQVVSLENVAIANADAAATATATNEQPAVLVPIQSDPVIETPQEGPLESLTIEATNYPAIINVGTANVQIVPQVDSVIAVSAAHSNQQQQQQQIPIATAPTPCVIDNVINQQQQQQGHKQEIFYQQAPPLTSIAHQQQQQQLRQSHHRAITEILGGSSNFFFLQESEIDTPEQIATQTFTNQTFVVQPSLPIPLPAHFQQTPPSQQVASAAPIAATIPQQIISTGSTLTAAAPLAVVSVTNNDNITPPVISASSSGCSATAAAAGNATLHPPLNSIVDKRESGIGSGGGGGSGVNNHAHSQQQYAKTNNNNSNNFYYNNGYNNSNKSNRHHQPHGGGRNNNTGQNRSQNNRH